MWCIVADNSDEFWVYGLFMDQAEAESRCAKMAESEPEIDYYVAPFLHPDLHPERK